MPRSARIDAPGVVQHVIVRGVDRRDLFVDDADRLDLLRRLARVLPEEGCDCLAWALMANHIHLVTRTGDTPLRTAMARVWTGYAMRFNERWDRVGHLVQNRYKSRLVHDVSDLLNLIRYVHLNPIRARIVRSIEDLSKYPWAGHGALLGSDRPWAFHTWCEVLELFDDDRVAARRRLSEFMRCAPERDPAETGDPDAKRLQSLVDRICLSRGVDPDELKAGARGHRTSRARREIVRLAATGLGMPHRKIAAAVGVSRPAVSKLVPPRKVTN